MALCAQQAWYERCVSLPIGKRVFLTKCELFMSPILYILLKGPLCQSDEVWVVFAYWPFVPNIMALCAQWTQDE